MPTPLTVIESASCGVLGAGEIGQSDRAGKRDDGESCGSEKKHAFHRENLRESVTTGIRRDRSLTSHKPRDTLSHGSQLLRRLG